MLAAAATHLQQRCLDLCSLSPEVTRAVHALVLEERPGDGLGEPPGLARRRDCLLEWGLRLRQVDDIAMRLRWRGCAVGLLKLDAGDGDHAPCAKARREIEAQSLCLAVARPLRGLWLPQIWGRNGSKFTNLFMLYNSLYILLYINNYPKISLFSL